MLWPKPGQIYIVRNEKLSDCKSVRERLDITGQVIILKNCIPVNVFINALVRMLKENVLKAVNANAQIKGNVILSVNVLFLVIASMFSNIIKDTDLGK